MLDTKHPFKCPFCKKFGAKVCEIEDPYPDVGMYFPDYAVCCSCGARGPIANTDKEAVEKWNGSRN